MYGELVANWAIHLIKAKSSLSGLFSQIALPLDYKQMQHYLSYLALFDRRIDFEITLLSRDNNIARIVYQRSSFAQFFCSIIFELVPKHVEVRLYFGKKLMRSKVLRTFLPIGDRNHTGASYECRGRECDLVCTRLPKDIC